MREKGKEGQEINRERGGTSDATTSSSIFDHCCLVPVMAVVIVVAGVVI